jgi:hypothetical protein
MKNHNCTLSHVPLYSLVESTQRVYGVRLFFVSARTNKRHHHHQRFDGPRARGASEEEEVVVEKDLFVFNEAKS